MTGRIRWSRRALSRLDMIGSYIAAQDPFAAARVMLRISTAVSLLAD